MHSLTTKEKVILKLLAELHVFCMDNRIDYYVVDSILNNLGDTQESRIEFETCTIFMDANNMGKFLSKYNMDGDSRILEWMGNSKNFYNASLHYNDRNTTYFRNNRCFFEDHLGMYVSINLLRTNPNMGRLEKAWMDICKKKNNARGFRHNTIIGVLNTVSKIFGTEYTAKIVHNSILKRNTGTHEMGEYYIIEDWNSAVEKYSIKYFSGRNIEKICGLDMCVPTNLKKYIKEHLSKSENEYITPDSLNRFSDTEFSYRKVDFAPYRDNQRNMYQKLHQLERQYEKEELEQQHYSNMIKASYNRYAFALSLCCKLDRLEALMEKEEVEELRKHLNGYVNAAKDARKNKTSVFICKRLNKLVEFSYQNIDIDDLFKYSPDFYQDGVKIYDHKGNLIEVYK